MKTITVAELRQNPAPALAEVAAGERLNVTKHRRVIAMLVPPIDDSLVQVIPARSSEPSELAGRSRKQVATYDETEALLEEMTSEW